MCFGLTSNVGSSSYEPRSTLLMKYGLDRVLVKGIGCIYPESPIPASYGIYLKSYEGYLYHLRDIP